MQRHTYFNLFTGLLIPWVAICVAALTAASWLFLWREKAQDIQQAENWGIFIRDLVDHEIHACLRVADIKQSNLLQSLVNSYQLDLAVFSPSGKCLFSSAIAQPSTIPPEGQMALKTGETITHWTKGEKATPGHLVVAWPSLVKGETYVVWLSLDLPRPIPGGHFARTVIGGGFLSLSIGIPIVVGIAWWSRRRLDAARKAILEGNLQFHPWEPREWHAFVQEIAAHFRAQREEMGVLQKIALDYEATLQSLPDGLIYVNLEGRVIKDNPAAARLLRLSGPSAEGFPLRECFRHPDFLTWADDFLALRHPPVYSFHNDELGQHLEIRGTELKASDNRVYGFLLIIRDTTQSWAADRIRRDFVANVSHELRTPLTSMKGFLETLLDGALDDPSRATRFIKIVYDQTERLERIVNDLLTLARLESESEQPIAREPVRVDELVTSAVGTCQLQAEQRSMQISWDAPSDLTIKVNARLLQQALVNLLDNAIKYSDPNKQIRIGVHLEGAELIFEVRDQGWGIEARHLPRIFERFYRVDPSRSRDLGGTGLGLAIVKHVAQLHGGRVTVDSRVGIGTAFRIHLPKRVIVEEKTLGRTPGKDEPREINAD
ncbi:MAG: sensor histidine kinase [Thermogutta sp.]